MRLSLIYIYSSSCERSDNAKCESNMKSISTFFNGILITNRKAWQTEVTNMSCSFLQ